MDMRGRIMESNGYQAVLRGPVLLARDSRFADGYIGEPAVIPNDSGIVELTPAIDKPENIWFSFTAPLVRGTDLEGEVSKPRQTVFCDFASAGNTWEEESRYRVWIPRPPDVRQWQGY
jgi:hypothetical protein